MFSTISYNWKANAALGDLGFLLHKIPSDFRMRFWEMARSLNLSPREAACAMVFDFPREALPPMATIVIDKWIANGEVRLEMLRALDAAKGELKRP